jgi:predicted amidohydrolase YtcJ
MKKIAFLVSAAALALLAFRSIEDGATTAPAQTIYVNGKVITVDSKNTIAQAVAVTEGKIVAVGSTQEIQKLKGPGTTVVDLGGKTLLPGFIDGHSHFMSLGRSNVVNVAAPPVGPVKKIADIVAEIEKFRQERNIGKGEWISAFGYDVDLLEEYRHPTREDLDKAFPDNPIVLTHVSGHMSVVNSLALKLSGIDSNTQDPAGGVIVRKKGSQEPTGLLQETAGRLLKRTEGKKLSLDEQLAQLKEQQEYYASHGITTAQDGATSLQSVKLLKAAADRKQLFIDIESLPRYDVIDSILNNPTLKFGALKDHLKLAGFKLTADGSPQGKTAFFSKPYLTEVPGCNHDHCTGVPTVTDEKFNEAILKGYKNNIQTYVHCNGDATIDMYIRAVENASKVLNTTSINRRSVIIHSQFVRPDQLDKYKALGMMPALFTNHAFFWGDVHLKNLGKERAFFLSPLKTAAAKGIVATNHTDFGVTPLNQLFLLWTSVARQSRSGAVIGPDERLTPLEGIRAITINGAYQYFEEKTKGTIETGKLADFVILSADPTAVATEAIKDIEVLETIKEGKTIFKKG